MVDFESAFCIGIFYRMSKGLTSDYSEAQKIKSCDGSAFVSKISVLGAFLFPFLHPHSQSSYTGQSIIVSAFWQLPTDFHISLFIQFFCDLNQVNF